MVATLTPDQQTFIDNLRAGNSLTLVKLPKLTQQLRDDFDNFVKFLNDHGQPAPQPADLYLTVKRQDVVDMLQYAKTNECLILQNCFGFDQPIETGGRVQLIQKGNLHQRPGATDATVFYSVYKIIKPVGPAATPKEFYELLLNMNPKGHLPVSKARQYIKTFRAYYPGRTRQLDPFTLGYLMPVTALLAELTNSTSVLGSADTLTFRWGLNAYNAVTMGDFTLVIGIGDTSTGPVIVFRSQGIAGAANYPLPPCPPNPGCQL